MLALPRGMLLFQVNLFVPRFWIVLLQGLSFPGGSYRIRLRLLAKIGDMGLNFEEGLLEVAEYFPNLRPSFTIVQAT